MLPLNTYDRRPHAFETVSAGTMGRLAMAAEEQRPEHYAANRDVPTPAREPYRHLPRMGSIGLSLPSHPHLLVLAQKDNLGYPYLHDPICAAVLSDVS